MKYGTWLLIGSVVTLLVAVLSLGTYWMLGKPDLPAEPPRGPTAPRPVSRRVEPVSTPAGMSTW